MPNLPNAAKRIRQDKKRRERNDKVESEIRNLAKKFMMALAAKKNDEAKKLGLSLVSKLDRARSRGIVHRNTVSRKKARILSKIAKIR
ncbi:MAG TPA: 30S ribosomal protein S20 [Candidatus Omnitrophota bacterium]|nr:30S ribosomal protein S20 [Candidatus Omnitrophota bacterium]MDD5270338.1 30S ribosomal protein S20 [Candidatus Omnitrophota bacterium]HOX09851.1 30S ribosomal protein S20 [Candidatus Omnitrophota bacterium]HPN65901.1 30S ribosomal protein S20 [Candidatus Omnitrophota bacterium]HRZ67288.1 30S ribosomal protein S20 [Candidatus Omnitrophota bacterium]